MDFFTHQVDNVFFKFLVSRFNGELSWDYSNRERSSRCENSLKSSFSIDMIILS